MKKQHMKRKCVKIEIVKQNDLLGEKYFCMIVLSFFVIE